MLAHLKITELLHNLFLDHLHMNRHICSHNDIWHLMAGCSKIDPNEQISTSDLMRRAQFVVATQ